MAYPVVLKKLLVSSLQNRLVVPFCPAVATATSRRAYHQKPVSLMPKKVTPRSEYKEDAENLYLIVDMPGLDKKDVKATVVECDEHNYMQIDVETVKDNKSLAYDICPKLPNDIKVTGIKGKMKAGVLTVTFPKLKKEEIMPDEFDVKVN